MAAPTSYSEIELKGYMLNILEGVGPSSAWSMVAFDEQINDVLIDYGVSDIANATDIPKLRTIARVHAWRKLARAQRREASAHAHAGAMVSAGTVCRVLLHVGWP